MMSRHWKTTEMSFKLLNTNISRFPVVDKYHSQFQGLIQDFTSGILLEKSNNLEKSNMINLKNLTSNSVWDSFFYKGNLCPVLCTVLSISK